jgi:hypothetical protein
MPRSVRFFWEGVELFSTPLRAVYTRTVTAPQWGARTTGKSHGVGYTVLFADDRGGGLAIVPAPTGSTSAPQDFGATVLVARAKCGFKRNFVSLLATDREARDGNGFNRVAGPDLQWRATESDTFSAQWLFSRTRTPNRPQDSSAWQGQSLSGDAAIVKWQRKSGSKRVLSGSRSRLPRRQWLHPAGRLPRERRDSRLDDPIIWSSVSFRTSDGST